MALTNISFDKQSKLTAIAIKQLIRIQGMKCQVYFPKSENTIYNDASQSYTYSTSSDEDGKFLITGLYDLRASVGIDTEFYNTFVENEILLYTANENLEFPRNSKIEIQYKNTIQVMRTQDTNIVEGLNGKPIYGVIQLVPFV